MKSMITKIAAATAASVMTLGAMAPFASAQVAPGYYGYGYGVSAGGLGQLFVLGSLFGGAYGNGVIGPYGTSLGDLLILNQIFHNGGIYW